MDASEATLLLAAEIGNFPLLEYILGTGGVDVNVQEPKTKRTALHLASIKGRADMVLALIKAGANPKLSDAFGKNPADYSTLSKVIYETLPGTITREKTPPSSQDYSFSEDLLDSSEEIELLVYDQIRDDNYLLGGIFVHLDDSLQQVHQRILDEIDNIPEEFTLSRHNGSVPVFINQKQMSQSVGKIFRKSQPEDRVVIICPLHPPPYAHSVGGRSSASNSLHRARPWLTPSAQQEAVLIADEDYEALKCDHTMKLFLVGDSSVGKSSLLARFAENQYRQHATATIGVDYKVRMMRLDGKLIKLQIWDTAGQERFRTITKGYFRRACGAILVYDVTNRVSFENMRNWLEEVVRNSEDDLSVVLVGNKCDDETGRQVSLQEGRQLAQDLDLLFFEASAKDDISVMDLFTILVRDYLYKPKPANQAEESGGVSLTPSQKKEGCCF